MLFVTLFLIYRIIVSYLHVKCNHYFRLLTIFFLRDQPIYFKEHPEQRIMPVPLAADIAVIGLDRLYLSFVRKTDISQLTAS